MREIKFRAKRIDTGTWVFGHYFKTPLTDENSGTTPDAGWFFLTGEPRHCIGQDTVAFVIDPNTLGEFTGLKDKNGKEIYEGDLVNVFGEGEDHSDGGLDPYDETLEVEFRDGQWWWGKWGNAQPLYDIDLDECAEVIGDVYENSELLK